MHVVITGSSSGIGVRLAREFHQHGAKVTLVARRGDLMRQLQAELKERCEVIEADLSVDATGWLARVEGPIDVFVNNAGFNISGPFDAAPSNEVARLFEVDLLAPIALARAVVPKMIARGSGALINISSVAGVVPPAGMAVYAAAKAGLGAFSEALHAELRGTGVHVLTVYPGPIDNGTAVGVANDVYGAAATSVPMATSEQLATAVLRALGRKDARLLFPRFYGLARSFPGIARWLVTRFTPPIKALPAGEMPAKIAAEMPGQT